MDTNERCRTPQQIADQLLAGWTAARMGLPRCRLVDPEWREGWDLYHRTRARAHYGMRSITLH